MWKIVYDSTTMRNGLECISLVLGPLYIHWHEGGMEDPPLEKIYRQPYRRLRSLDFYIGKKYYPILNFIRRYPT